MFRNFVTSCSTSDFWENFLINRVLDMYSIEGMDEEQEFETLSNLLLGGRVAFFEYRGEVVSQYFNAGGQIGLYRTFYDGLVANPKIENPPHLTFGENAVAVYLNRTDRYRDRPSHGLSSLIYLTASQLSDNSISIENLQFIKRLPTVFTARTDTEKSAVEVMLNKIALGLKSIVARVPLNDSVKRLDGGQGVALLQEFTEYQQYILGNFYQAIGISCPWNTKRERVTSTESEQNIEVLKYNVHRQFKDLQKQFDAVNAMFGTNYKIIRNIDEVRDELREEEKEVVDEQPTTAESFDTETDNTEGTTTD